MACQFPQNIHTIAFDLADENYDSLEVGIKKHFANIDILVNNAAMILHKSFVDSTTTDCKDVFRINILAPIKLTRMLYPLFNKKSHIVNIGSMGGVQGSVKFAGLSLYSASKAALATLTECLAVEFEKDEIAVNCLCFGAVATEGLKKAFPGYEAPISADEIAAFTADFACNGQRFFNGKVLPVATSTP
jgi:3-oxoacyl-[acyl-carrier protein] reductase